MTEMSSRGKFVPKEHESDYDPCYKHYGLKHGQLSRYSDDMESENFRTAIQGICDRRNPQVNAKRAFREG